MRLGHEPIAAQGDGYDVFAHPAFHRYAAGLRCMAVRCHQGSAGGKGVADAEHGLQLLPGARRVLQDPRA
jgi:hypothetical protein